MIESYFKSPDWILHKGATINPKNEKNNECFQWSTTSALNYDKIKKKTFEKNRKIKKGSYRSFNTPKRLGKIKKTIL